MSWLDPLLAIKTQQAGTTAGTRQTINFASGATVTDDPVNDRVNVAITGSGITQLTGDVTAGPGSGSVAATVAKVNGVSVSGTPASGQVIRATSGTASAWANVARGDITNTSGAVGDLITGNATTLTRLGIGSTGQVLTVSGGAPVWAAASPSLIWEADFTTGQTAQSWTAGSTYAVVGSSGTGNINFKHNGGAVPNAVAMVAASGLEVTYANGTNNPASSINCALSQLGLGYIAGRPWRVWIYQTYSGTITTGTDNMQFLGDLDGTGASNSSTAPTYYVGTAKAYTNGTAFQGANTFNVGTDVTSTNSNYSSSNVVLISCVAGVLSFMHGAWSSGWPSISSMYAQNAGVIAPGQIAGSTGAQTPYIADAGLCLRVLGLGTPINMTSRKVIFKAMKFEGL